MTRRQRLRTGPRPDHVSARHTAVMPVGRGAPFLLLATGSGLVLVCPWVRPRQRRRLTDQQMEAIAGVQDRLAASSAWVGASAAWISEDVTPFRPISPAWVQRQLADHVAVTVPAHVAVPAQALDLPPEATLLAELDRNRPCNHPAMRPGEGRGAGSPSGRGVR